MDNNEYLKQILESQTLASDSEELQTLREHRADVEALIRKHFKESSPTIRYGGSKAKGTMIREAYDLDIISYFSHDDTTAGESLEDIYNNTHDALSTKYAVEGKPSALRIKGKDPENQDLDFHIDVVPGRFTDDSETDVFLYRASGEKKRLKTNLDVHINYVKDSAVTEAICLLKLWRIRNVLTVKHFALELLVIDLLKRKKSAGLDTQLVHVWKELRDNIDQIAIEDPANPTGNDLSDLLSSSVRSELSSVARSTLRTIEDAGWELVFGPTEDKEGGDKTAKLQQAASVVVVRSKPWHWYR
jgi:hypothetical protein